MSLESIIHNLDLTNVKTKYGTTFGQELVNAANELSNCIQSRINHSYGGSSIKTSDIADIQVDGMSLSITINIPGAIYPSIFNIYNGKVANVFWLLNDGFTVKKTWYFEHFKNPERWIHREAERYVEDGISDFESKNRLGIKVIRKSKPNKYYW